MFDPEYQRYKRWQRANSFPEPPPTGDPMADFIMLFIWYSLVLTVWALWVAVKLLWRLASFLVRLALTDRSGPLIGHTALLRVTRDQTVKVVGQGSKVWLSAKIRPKHTHIIGPTGSGKTTLLKNLIVQDFRAGHGVIVMDPKGGLIPSLLRHIPPNRVEDVILFDPTDRDQPVGFNILKGADSGNPERSTDGFVQSFIKLHHGDWGVRLNRVLTFAAYTLMQVPDSTILDLRPLLYDDSYRQQVLTHVANPHVREFWQMEYPDMTRGGMKSQVITPIFNRIDVMLFYPTIANIVGQPRSSFDLTEVLQQRKILLINIPEGPLGEGLSNFLGAVLVTQIQQAAMGDLAIAQKRPQVYFYIDEFQNFRTSAFDKIITEARAFKLGLIVANQYSEQLEMDLRHSLDHNVAVRLSCGTQNGRHVLLYHRVQEQDVRLAKPLVARPPLPPGNPAIASQVVARSRQKYGLPRVVVAPSHTPAATPPTIAAEQKPTSAPAPTPPQQQPTKPGRSLSDILGESPESWIED
jgi:hypothetical protein